MPKVKTSRIDQKQATRKLKRSKRAKKSENNAQSFLLQAKSQLSNLAVLRKIQANSLAYQSKRLWLILLVLGLVILLYYKKSLFIAAMVNGSPITTFQLIQQLNSQYKDQVLNQMINEKIILDAARKKGVVVSDAEINDRISTLEKNVGGAQVLDSLLAQQGQTRQGLKSQIRIQISVEKLYADETTASAQEIQDFIDQNKDKLTATDSAGQQKEATDLIKNQKLSKVFNDKFQQLKQQSNIQIF